MAAGLLLLAAALFLTFFNIWDGKRAEQAAAEVAARLREQIAENAASDEDGDSDKNGDNMYYDNPDEMPVIEIDGNEYIGILEIPSLDLSLPVMADWDYDKLKISPCRFLGSYGRDDLVIAGHNYARHFSPIKGISTESEVFFINVEGNVYSYRVAWAETLAPDRVEEMAAGDWDLTLFTCTTGGRMRYAVRCVRE